MLPEETRSEDAAGQDTKPIEPASVASSVKTMVTDPINTFTLTPFTC